MRVAASIVLALAAVLGATELLLRGLPVSTTTATGYHHDPDLLTYPSGHAWTVSTGWDLRNPQRLHANNWGFAAHRDFVADTEALALIGDSYVEASMLDAEDRPGAQLERMLAGSRSVYAMGSPGTAMLDYAQRIRVASQRFGVRDFVIWMERGDARQSLCGSGNVHSRCLDPQTLEPRVERIPPPGWLKQMLRHSALAQYFAGQLKFRPRAFVTAVLTRNAPEVPGIAPAARDSTARGPSEAAVHRERRIIDEVLRRFSAQAGPYLVGRTIVVVDGNRAGAAGDPQSTLFQRAYLLERLRGLGYEVVDLEPVFASHAARSPLSLEVGPYDRHLNALGVAVAMREVNARLGR